MGMDAVPPEHQDLFGVRTDTPYTLAERHYSALVQSSLEELLEGRRRQMVLLRRYHGNGSDSRLAVFPAGPAINRSELRQAMVERILISTIAFMRDVSPGGPVFQEEDRHHLVETQHFSTKYPHIIIERVDTFRRDDRAPISTEWRLVRTQNQRAETQINRWIDATNLAVSVIQSLRGK